MSKVQDIKAALFRFCLTANRMRMCKGLGKNPLTISVSPDTRSWPRRKHTEHGCIGDHGVFWVASAYKSSKFSALAKALPHTQSMAFARPSI